MAQHRFSPPLAGIDSLAFRPAESVHPFAYNRALQKLFFLRRGIGEKRADCFLAGSLTPSQRWPHRGQHRLRRPGFPRATDCMPEGCETRTAESERSNAAKGQK